MPDHQRRARGAGEDVRGSGQDRGHSDGRPARFLPDALALVRQEREGVNLRGQIRGAALVEPFVQQKLGHHSSAFTLRAYGHLLPRGTHRAADALDDATIRNAHATEDLARLQ
jgi:hypothetical protein